MKLTVRMALVTIVSTAAYLALAVFAFGGIAAFVGHPPLVVVALVTLLATIVALFSSGNLSTGVREDRGNRWVLAAFGVLGFLGAWVPAYTDRIGFWTLDGEALRWLGVVVYIAGLVLRMWPVFVLGRRFSGLVAIQPDHTLVTTGIYGMIRNPSYLGLLLISLGWALAFRAGAGILLTIVTFVPLIARIQAEEALLRSHFGADYDRYCSHTWRLIPGVY